MAFVCFVAAAVLEVVRLRFAGLTFNPVVYILAIKK